MRVVTLAALKASMMVVAMENMLAARKVSMMVDPKVELKDVMLAVEKAGLMVGRKDDLKVASWVARLVAAMD